MLRAFIDQSHVELLYPVVQMRTVWTQPVRGDYTPQDALNLALADTGYSAQIESQTLVIRAQPPHPRNRVSDKSILKAVPARKPSGEDDDVVRLEGFQVNSGRDEWAIMQSLTPTTERSAVYHQVLDRAKLDQLGQASLPEALGTLSSFSGNGISILQTTSDLVNRPLTGLAEAGALLQMRGYDSQRTVVLLNGRRLPHSRELGGADLSRIPLAAVERIEVMPMSGSALYGDGALGGAVNVILRRDYAGRSLTTHYGISSRGDAQEYAATLLEGKAFNRERTHFTVSLDYFHRDALLLGDRDYLKRAEAKLYSLSNVTQVNRLQSHLLDEFRQNPTLISLNRGTSLSGLYYNFPDVSGELPVFSTGQLTQQDRAQIGERPGRNVIIRPTVSWGATLHLDHQLWPGKVEVYGELVFGRSKDEFSFPDGIPVTALSFGNPYNPFRNDIFSSARILVDPIDVPDHRLRQTRSGQRGVIGIRSHLTGDWIATLDTAYDQHHASSHIKTYTELIGELLNISATALDAGTVGRVRPEIAYAIYNPLSNHGKYPVNRETLEQYFRLDTYDKSRADVTTCTARLQGSVIKLPSGKLRLGLSGETWREHINRQIAYDYSTGVFELASNLDQKRVFYAPVETPLEADAKSFGAEVELPLIGSKFHPWSTHELLVNFALRNSTYGIDGSRADTRMLSGKYSPVPGLSLRGSVSEGVFPVAVLKIGPVTQIFQQQTIIDPARPGVTNIRPVRITQGAGADLIPEKSDAYSFGAILQPKWMQGFFATADYWQIKRRDGIVQHSFTTLVASSPFFADRIVRDEPSTDDISKGRPGAINAVDLRPGNFARRETNGIDVRLNYDLPWRKLGPFTLSADGSFTLLHREQISSTAPIIDQLGILTTDSGLVLPLKLTSSLGWRGSRWHTLVTSRYLSSYRTQENSPTPYYPKASGIDGDKTSSSINWDFQLGYEFPYAPPSTQRAHRRLLAGTHWTLGVRNLFDHAPAYVSDGVSYYSRLEDPRQRFFTLRVQKNL